MVPLLYLVGLAASEQTPPELWVALVGVIMALIAIGPRLLEFASGKKAEAATSKPDPLVAILTQLTVATNESANASGRLADVLERMQAENAKSAEDVRRRFEELGKVLERFDYRTREIRDDVKQMPALIAAMREQLRDDIKRAPVNNGD